MFLFAKHLWEILSFVYIFGIQFVSLYRHLPTFPSICVSDSESFSAIPSVDFIPEMSNFLIFPEHETALAPEQATPTLFHADYAFELLSDDSGNEYTDTESEDEPEDEYDDIDGFENARPFAEKEDGKYYLGMPWVSHDDRRILLNASISAEGFFAFDFVRVCQYIRLFALFYARSNQPIEIMRLSIHHDGVYEVVLKTHWLRIVQRTWRKVYRERRRIYDARMSVPVQAYVRKEGRYPPSLEILPSLRGMMAST